MYQFLIKTGAPNEKSKAYESNNRDPKKHIEENWGIQNGAWCDVFNRQNGEKIASARCDNGEIFDAEF